MPPFSSIMLELAIAREGVLPMLLALLGTGLCAIVLSQLGARVLFERCAQVPNDEAAWREFLQRYSPHIFSAIYRILGYPPTGRYYYLFDDVLQRVHLRLLENNRRALHSFRGEDEGSAQAYLRKIATGIALKTLPQKGLIKLPIDVFLADPTFHINFLSEQQSFSEDYIALRQDIDSGLNAILRGRNKYRNMLIFKLSFFSGLTPTDIVQVMGIRIKSPHAIEQLIYRMREKLAMHLFGEVRE